MLIEKVSLSLDTLITEQGFLCVCMFIVCVCLLCVCVCVYVCVHVYMRACACVCALIHARVNTLMLGCWVHAAPHGIGMQVRHLVYCYGLRLI